jgi:hypothetical protein
MREDKTCESMEHINMGNSAKQDKGDCQDGQKSKDYEGKQLFVAKKCNSHVCDPFGWCSCIGRKFALIS